MYTCVNVCECLFLLVSILCNSCKQALLLYKWCPSFSICENMSAVGKPHLAWKQITIGRSPPDPYRYGTMDIKMIIIRMMPLMCAKSQNKFCKMCLGKILKSKFIKWRYYHQDVVINISWIDKIINGGFSIALVSHKTNVLKWDISNVSQHDTMDTLESFNVISIWFPLLALMLQYYRSWWRKYFILENSHFNLDIYFIYHLLTCCCCCYYYDPNYCCIVSTLGKIL